MTLQSAVSFKQSTRQAVDFMLYSLHSGIGTISFPQADLQAYDAVRALPGNGILRERDLYNLLYELERLRIPAVYYIGTQAVTYALASLTQRMRLQKLSRAMVSRNTATEALNVIRTARLWPVNYTP